MEAACGVRISCRFLNDRLLGLNLRLPEKLRANWIRTKKVKTPQSLSRCFLLLFFCSLLLDGCQPGTSEPSVEFTKIPVSAVGGLDNMDAIEGRVIGVRPEQRIVLYAESGGRWWIQPFARDPLFTKIQGDSKWKNETHLGEEYAALLVDPRYSPPHASEESSRL